MLPAGFETAIPAGERLQTYTLDREATGTGVIYIYIYMQLQNIKYKIHIFNIF